ncbi:4682_t:CDS:2, partial [Dentiscutata heterogama]
DNIISESYKNNVQNFDDKENILPGSLAFTSSQSSINKTVYKAENNDDINSNDGDNEAGEESLFEESDPALDKSIRKFVSAYKKRRLVQDTHVRPAISSFFQTCDWNAKRTNGNSYQRGGKKIRVQVASTARRKELSSKGQKRMRKRDPTQDTIGNE